LFLGHNFQTANARKPTKGSTDADFRLGFTFKKKQKLPFGVGDQGPMNVGN